MVAGSAGHRGEVVVRPMRPEDVEVAEQISAEAFLQVDVAALLASAASQRKLANPRGRGNQSLVASSRIDLCKVWRNGLLAHLGNTIQSDCLNFILQIGWGWAWADREDHLIPDGSL